MNLWNDSERKWALEHELKPEIEGIHLHEKVCPNKWNKPQIPMDTNNLPLRGQSVEFY